MDFIVSFLRIFWEILKNWWWLPLPFILYDRFTFFWNWYRVDKFDSQIEKIVLEVRIPRDIEKPIKAMEQVFLGIHGYHDVFNWKETWLEGEFLNSLSFEIVSTEGTVHFFIRCPAKARGLIESNIYAQYPGAEISLAEDYVKLVPKNTPNKDWDCFGLDMVVTKPNPYPIKTYDKIEDARETKEQKRIDPLAGLLDGMATIGKGEHLWVQMVAKPIRDEVPWMEEGKKIIDDLVHRKKKDFRYKPMVMEAADVLITGKPPSGPPEEKEEGFLPPEMKLTPGEREIVQAIERKIGQFGYQVNIRFLYLGKKDVFFKAKARIPYGLFKTVSTENLNGLKPWPKTLPKIQWFFRQARTYVRKREMFKRYIRRLPPLFPINFSAGTYVLASDEMATIYHFPGRAAAPAPSVPRIEAKKTEAPRELPSE